MTIHHPLFTFLNSLALSFLHQSLGLSPIYSRNAALKEVVELKPLRPASSIIFS